MLVLSLLVQPVSFSAHCSHHDSPAPAQTRSSGDAATAVCSVCVCVCACVDRRERESIYIRTPQIRKLKCILNFILIRSFVSSFILSFIHSFIHSYSIHSFTHSFTLILNNGGSEVVMSEMYQDHLNESVPAEHEP